MPIRARPPNAARPVAALALSTVYLGVRQAVDRPIRCSGRRALRRRRCMRRSLILFFCAALRGARPRVRSSRRQRMGGFAPTLAGTIAAPMQHRTGDHYGCQCACDDDRRQRLRRYPSDRNRGCQPERRRYRREIDLRKLQIVTQTDNDHAGRRRGGDHVNRQFLRRQIVEHHRPQQPKGCKHDGDVNRVSHA